MNGANTPAKIQTRGASTKTSPEPSPARLALDATQKALIAKLETSREPWQTIGRYEPERAHEHPAARRASGSDIRARIPHEAHAEWLPPKRRPSPVDIVVAGNAGRQEHLVPLRMGRMAASPFAFLRGAAAVMAWDLSHTPVSGIQVIIDGDAHINNFGLYGAPLTARRRPTAVKVPDSAWAVIQKTVAKAKRTTNQTLLPKVAHRTNDGGWRFQNHPPIQTRVDDDARRKVVASLVGYSEHLSPAYRAMLQRYSVADVAHRVVGVGSVGTRAYLALCFGNGDSDPLFLQVKEAIVPVHAPYLPPMLLRDEHQGRRVIGAQRILQSLGDPMLGYTAIDERPFFVRQMKNMKASMPVSLMTGEPFDFWALLCGGLLARAHARYGDAARIAGYCGDEDALDRALADFAEAYGDQTERDHAELVKAIKTGTVAAIEG